MVRPVRISEAALKKEPHLAWNAFINLIAMSDYEGLSEVQRVAHLVFWYESEVQNGGHLQYFEDRGPSHLDETVSALKTVGATEQAAILAGAIEQLQAKARRPIRSVKEFVSRALEGEHDKYDRRFYACERPLTGNLEEYLERNFEEFIQLV